MRGVGKVAAPALIGFPGGCAINAADGLTRLGVQVDLFASLGAPPHPAFEAVTRQCRSARSWCSHPGRTLAFEFQDGKVMFSAVTQLAELTPDLVSGSLRDEFYLEQCRRARVIVLADWTLFPHMTAVWRLLHKEIYSQLRHRPHFFIDLVDPSSRTGADILDMLAVLLLLQQCGDVCLGLNINEANILARLHELPECTAAAPAALCALLRQRLAVAEVVVHSVKAAASATQAHGAQCLDCIPWCERPVKSTGAGDRFNAGYCVGLMLECTPLQRLHIAAASAGCSSVAGLAPCVLHQMQACLCAKARAPPWSKWPRSSRRTSGDGNRRVVYRNEKTGEQPNQKWGEFFKETCAEWPAPERGRSCATAASSSRG